ncbi:MAG: vitamin K epoxide reductase family protein [Actinobacteria bacterium]|nr:vitamin K epoxide reductase family protein [Actinomycetota bacterium]
MRRTLAAAAAALLLLVITPPASAQGGPTVRGLFFYSPTCGHCHKVVVDDLPGIFAEHGGAPSTAFDVSATDNAAFTILSNGTLELLMVNVTTEAGTSLYATTSTEYDIPSEQRGVPRLVIGDEFYVGSGAIPAALPGLIDAGLAAGGTDWPSVTGLDWALGEAGVPGETIAEETTTTTFALPAESGPTTPAAGTETTTTTLNPFPDVGGTPTPVSEFGEPLVTVGDKFGNDPAGNTLAVVVLAGMLASLALVWVLVRRGRLGSAPGWLVPALAVAGILVAIYLTYVETSGSEAVCGPVGNCNAVQQSKFALLFGVIHVGLVGLISYAVVVAAWLASRLLKPPWADWAAVALALGAAGGVAFSIYLTFLEPFVIGSTCIWCLSSAVIVTALFWVTAGPGWTAWRRLRTR